MPKLIGYTGWTDDHKFRTIHVGQHIEIVENDHGGAGATIRVAGGETILDAREEKYLAVSLLSWMGFCGLPGEHTDDPLKESIAHIADVQDELEKWNARARSDEEHPPYDNLCVHLEEALLRLKRMQEILNAK